MKGIAADITRRACTLRQRGRRARVGLGMIMMVGLWTVLGRIAPADNPQTIGEQIRQMEAEYADATGQSRLDLLLKLCTAYWRIDAERSVAYGEEALALARELKNLEGEVDALNDIGAARRQLNQLEESLAAYRQALTRSEEAGYTIGRMKALGNLGTWYHFRREYDTARNYYTDALDLARRLEDTTEQGKLLRNVGLTHQNSGDNRQALVYHRQALELVRAGNSWEDIIRCLNSIAMIHEDNGDYQQAVTCYLEAMATAESIELQAAIADTASNLAKTYWRLEDYAAAEASLRRALDIHRANKDDQGVAHALNNLGIIARYAKEYDKAIVYYEQALAIKNQLGDLFDILTTYLNIGNIHLDKGDLPLALARFTEALAGAETLGDRSFMAEILLALGTTYRRLNRYNEAMVTLRRCQAIAETGNFVEVDKDAWLQISRTLSAQGQYKEALAAFERYASIKDRILDESRQRQITEMRTRYDAEQKERENDLLKKDNEIQALTISRQRTLVWLFVVLAVLALTVLGFVGRRLAKTARFWRQSHYLAHFRLLEKLGRGGTGTVYRALNMVAKQEVALKVIDEELVDSAGRDRFIQEGLISEHITHPNVIRVFERGEHNGRLYYAMEYVDGITLRQVIRDKPPELRVALGLLSVLADAVHDMHVAGVIHRDLKPENIMLARGIRLDGGMLQPDIVDEIRYHLKILDFGLAKILEARTMTRTAMLAGTLHYLAPEYLFGKKVREEAMDFYSLGIVFYELCTGRLPFPEGEAYEVIYAIVQEPAPPPAEVNAEIPPAVSAFALDLIAKKPSERLKDYAAIRDALDGLMASS
ncbi:MAG: tetratricopeptide repeat protein [Acidobacteria bacterium]|nr:tetratricopeptide repeat protein [Acidobacteriota bacterium]